MISFHFLYYKAAKYKTQAFLDIFLLKRAKILKYLLLFKYFKAEKWIVPAV